MRSFSVLIISTTLCGGVGISSAQDFDGFRPAFANDEGGFDRRMRDIDLDPSPEAPAELAIEIAGTKIAPDFKHKGLKIMVPFDPAGAPERGIEPEEVDEAR